MFPEATLVVLRAWVSEPSKRVSSEDQWIYPAKRVRSAARLEELGGREKGGRRQAKAGGRTFSHRAGSSGQALELKGVESAERADRQSMHTIEGVKSTPRAAEGLCRRVTIGVHRRDTAVGEPGENKPEKVALYNCATLSKHADKGRFSE